MEEEKAELTVTGPDGEDPSSGGAERKYRLWLFIGSGLLATVLRIVYLIPLRGQPLFDEPHRDSVFYVERAREILSGDILGSGVSFHSSPLYPFFLALVMGPGGEEGLWWVRIVQALLSGLTVGFLALSAYRLFGRSAGVATALLSLFYAPFLFYAGELLEITLTLLFLSMMAWLVARDELDGKRLFLAGACLGLAALGKPNLLLLAPLLAIHLGFLRPLLRPLAWPWRRVIILALGLLVVILPFTLRNRLAGEDWVLISSNGGINLFIGNNPTSSGGFWVPSAMQYDLKTSSLRVAEEALGRELKPSEASRFWAERAWHFMRTRPGEAAHNFLRKTGLLLGHYEIPNHFNIYFFREYLAPLLRWPLVRYTIVLPLAALGLIFASRRSRATGLAAWSTLVVGASVVLFFVTSRYRLPILIWLLPFAGAGLMALWRLLRERRWRLLPLPLLIVVLVSAILYLPLLPAQDFNEDWITISNHWARQEEWEKVAFYSQQALREDMESAPAWQNLGYAYFQLWRDEDDVDRSEECLWRAISIDPSLGHAYGNLAALYFKLNRTLLVKPCLERALALDPALEEQLSMLRKLVGTKQSDFNERAEGVLARIEENLAANPEDLDNHVDKAYFFAMRLEKYDEALEVLNVLDQTALMADATRALRVEKLRDRIARAQRYTPILWQPLDSVLPGVSPDPR